METLFSKILHQLKKGRSGALATIVRRRGSVPRDEGAHLFVTTSGQVTGTIGGGGLEAEVLTAAGEIAGTSEGRLLTFSLVEGDDPSDMVCGGNVTVLVEPITDELLPVFEFIVMSLARHEPCCLFRLFTREGNDTAVSPGPRGAVGHGGTCVFSETVGEPEERLLVTWAQVAMKEETGPIRMLDRETLGLPPAVPWDLAVFETLQVYPRLVIFGGGHLSQALCRMAALCKFQVEVLDDRKEFANKEKFPEAVRAFHLPGYEKIADLLPLDPHTFVVIATRGHRFDEAVLAQVTGHDLAYVGMVGSRQKNAIVFDRLRQRGVPDAALKQVHAPIGVPIGSETPEEIAVSILAEIIQTRSRKKKRE